MKLATLFSAAMLAFLTLSLSACGGSDKCKTNGDCGANQTCNTDSGECVAAVTGCVADASICRGGLTCNTATGACEGTCCTSQTCVDPRTACNETRCAAGDGTAACEAKVCTDDPNTSNGCKALFKCNAGAATPTCEAACLTDGCGAVNENCDPTDGTCGIRLPLPKEVGSPCATDAECDTGSGLSCFSEADYGITSGYCSSFCSTDAECPTGAFCGTMGICVDGCDSQVGDCAMDQQCITVDGNKGDYCWPVFDQSDCTTNCLSNGTPCDSTIANQCEEGSACVGFGNGEMCMAVNCSLGIDPVTGATLACDQGQTCQNLGNSLSGCMNDCDPTSATACSSLSNTAGNSICAPNPQVDSNFDAFFEVSDPAKCAGTNRPDVVTVDINGQAANLCTAACTVDADCNPGQFCDDVVLNLTSGGAITFKSCMNYNIKDSVSCADSPCGTHACQDLALGGGTSAVVCHDTCSSDADCSGGFGGGCNRIDFLSGDSVNMCLYDTAGAFCFFGCANDSDCGYCQVDADCPTQTISQGVTRKEKCDVTSNTCVMPINGVAEVADYCSGSDVYWVEAINSLDAGGNPTKVGGCATPCKDDLDCAAGVACVANPASPDAGFCARQTTLCNGPTGQCEAACSTDTDCLHNQCSTAQGPAGESRCVAGCQVDADCGNGVCDTGLGYCAATQLWNLNLDISNLTAADGDTVYVVVSDVLGASLQAGSAAVSAGAVSFAWNDFLKDGGDFNVDFYLDVIVDGACVDADDLVYRQSLTAVNADQTVAFDASGATETPAACASF